jgi:hypothetical protein
MGPRAKTLASCAALALQGPFIAYLSRRSPAGYAAFSAAWGTLALGLGAFLGGPRARGGARDQALMATTGTLAMLFGWFADAGFRPLVGNAVCLCGCPGSLTGLGLISRLHWMQLCMVAACAGMILVAERERPARGPWRTAREVAASSLSMLAGMAVAGWLAGTLRPVSPAPALLTAYLAMSAGMVVGAGLAARLPSGARDRSLSNEASSHDGWAPPFTAR